MNNVSMQTAWEDLHVQPRFQPVYPHEIVVRWAFQNFKSLPGARVLDLGCGTGRHALFLAREGFDAYATDISRTGVAATLKRAKEINVTVMASAAPLHQLDFQPGFFDGIMSYGVFNYASYDEIKESLVKIHASLKPGGKLLVVMRGEKDWRLNYAEKMAEATYKMTKLGQGTPSDVEQGMIQCYLSAEQIRDVFGIFSTLQIDSLTLTWQNGKFCDQDYIIQAEK